jgi:DNA invertase Pin-like site-specific DNA recombinase
MRAGAHTVIEETRSGAAQRPALERILAELVPGDQLVVYKVDRLARSLRDLLRILDRVAQAGATFRSLTEPIETGTPIGRMLLQVLGAIAELERSMILERCAFGRAAAIERGVKFGRRPRIDANQVHALLSRGLTPREVAARLGCDRSTVARVATGARRCDGGPGDAAFRTRKVG